MGDQRPAKRVRRERIEINILAHPRYVRGACPRPQKITLLPPDDDPTGYIVDKIIIPADPEIEKIDQRRLYYIVGWRDDPIARVAIPCDRVYDYVSPGKVEAWEWQDLLRREQEAAVETAGKPEAEIKKRHGRPRRNGATPSTPIPDEEETTPTKKKAAGGPSLSTPQKPRAFLTDITLGEYDDGDLETAEWNCDGEEDDETILQLFQQPSVDADGDYMSGRDYQGLGEAADRAEEDEGEDPVSTQVDYDVLWEVQRLEGDKMVDVNGKSVRYFKVRWKGNWPPDQNPSWEPEENINEKIIREYLEKKAAARDAATASAAGKEQLSASSLPRTKTPRNSASGGASMTQKTLTGWLMASTQGASRKTVVESAEVDNGLDSSGDELAGPSMSDMDADTVGLGSKGFSLPRAVRESLFKDLGR